MVLVFLRLNIILTGIFWFYKQSYKVLSFRMKLFITVKPRAKEEAVERLDDTHFVVRVRAPSQEGKANRALIRALAKHFAVAPSRVEILSGSSSRKKVVSIAGHNVQVHEHN